MPQNNGQAAGRAFDPTTMAMMPSDTVTKLVLLRHGEVEDFGKRIVRGQLDAPLSQAGHAQHERLVTWLHEHEPAPDMLYSSDLSRCSDLAARLETVWGRAATVTKLLREQSLGRWQGRSWEEVSVDDGPLVTAYWDNYAHVAPPGGESMGQMGERVVAWLTGTLQKHPGKSIVISTHIGVIRALLCHLLGTPPDQALRFAPAVASTTEILISDAGPVLTRLGERPWMWNQ